jgi:hypothetical protein
MARKKKKTLTDAEIAQAVVDAADAAERGGRSSGIRIGDRRFHLEGRQLGTEATETTEGTEVTMDADAMSVDPLVATSSVHVPVDQTQTASQPRASSEGRPDSSESEGDTSQFVITPRSSAPDSTPSVPPSDP